jgi:hypothetical protein
MQARIAKPTGLTFGPDGGLYWSDMGTSVIRRMDLASNQVTTVRPRPRPGAT